MTRKPDLSQVAQEVKEVRGRQLPRYPAYKPSGVQWLDDIPEHWQVRRLKYVGRVESGGTPSMSNREYWDGDIPWVSPKDMGCFYITDTADHITEMGLVNSSSRMIPEGAVLLVVRSGILRHSIPVAINRVPVAINQDIRAMTLREGYAAKYLAYLIEGNQRTFLNLWSKQGCTVESIEVPDLVNHNTIVPPTDEQHAIVSFLDRETAEIDTLIAKKRRLIELLKEKRTALISRAVTKGLNPKAPMKPSGIDWLGDVPAHWTVERLRFSMKRIEQGWSPQCHSRQASPDEWGVLKVGCVNGVEFDETEHKALPSELEPFVEYEIGCGDILMSRANTRELLGSAAYVEQVRERLLLCDKLYRVRINESRVDGRYLVFAFGAAPSRYHFERESDGASGSMKNIGQDSVKNLWVPLPPPPEQKEIVLSIKRDAGRLDRLMLSIRSAIERLHEYRSALISAAVTGKIDVRGEVA